MVGGFSAAGRRCVLALLAALAVVGCRSGELVSLESVAAPEAVEPEAVASAPALPLVRLAVRHPDAFQRRLAPLSPLLPDAFSKWTDGESGVPRLSLLSGIFAELSEVRIAVVEATSDMHLEGLHLDLALRPAGGTLPETLTGPWQETLRRLLPDSLHVTCAVQHSLVVCTVDPNSEAAHVGPFAERAAEALAGEQGRLQLDLYIQPLLRVAEGLATVPLVWAVVPEQVRTLERLELQLTEQPDALTLQLEGRESRLLRQLAALPAPVARPITMAPSPPLLVYGAFEDIEERLDNAQAQWSDKLPIPKPYRVQTVLNDSWKSQLLELASGLAGAVLVGTFPALEFDPMEPFLSAEGLVYFIQVGDRNQMEERLLHIFKSKYFRLVDKEHEVGIKLTRALWKHGRGRANTERMAWFVEESTYYFGPSELLIRFVEARNETPPEKRLSLTLDAGEAIRIQVAPGPLIQQATLDRKAGIPANLALGMVKTSFAEVGQQAHLHIAGGALDDGRQFVRLTGLDFLATWDAVVTRLESLISLLAKIS